MNPREQLSSPVYPLEEDLEKTDFDERIKNKIRNHMTGQGIFNAINIFAEATGYGGENKLIDLIHPLVKYEEYIKKVFSAEDEKAIDFILSHSNQEAVGKLNAVIQDLNNELEKIGAKTPQRIMDLIKKAQKIILGEKIDLGFEDLTAQQIKKIKGE